MTQQEQAFAETVRLGWKWNPQVLESIKSGHTNAKEQAEAYFDVDETNGLSIEEATSVIEKCLQSPEY